MNLLIIKAGIALAEGMVRLTGFLQWVTGKLQDALKRRIERL